jgi:hypothetical protein
MPMKSSELRGIRGENMSLTGYIASCLASCQYDDDELLEIISDFEEDE